MTDRIFLDTNVLVYLYEGHDPLKQQRAKALVRDCIQDESGVLSVQVLGEFFTVVTRRLSPPLSVEAALEILRTFDVLPAQEIDRKLVQRAIDTHREYAISYWDALIVAAAERAGCRRILTEDLNDGQRYHGIAVENPFRSVAPPA